MTRARFSRRVLLRSGLALAAGSALAGCAGAPAAAPTEAPAATKEAPVEAATAAPPTAETIEVWNANWGETYNPPMRKLGEAYQEATGTKVEWSFNDQWQEKLLTAIAAGIPPDCCYTNYVGLPTLAHEGVLLPLDDYFDASGIKHADFIKAMMDACIYEGKTYAIPGGADFLAVVYSKDVYRDAGLDPEQPPKTLAEWVEHSEQIYQFDDNGNIIRMGMDPRGTNLMYHGFGFGGEFYDANAKKVICNEGGVVEALEWMVGNAEKWPVEKVAAFTEGMPGYSQPNSGIATGRQTYLFTGYWFAEALDKYAPDLDYGVAFLPTPNGTEEERSTYVVQGWDYSIPKGSKHPDAAWAFMKFAFYDNAADMGVATINGNCVLSQMDKYVEGVLEWLGPDNRLTPYFHVFAETGAAGEKFWPVMPVSSRYRDEIRRAEDFAVRGEKTPQEALDEAARIVQEELDAALAG